jgi:hypothetical protein
MSKIKAVGCVMVLASFFVVCAGCPSGPKRVLPPGINSNAGDDAIKEFDTNKDGKISGPELDKCPGIKAAIAQIDKAGSGEVTADMIYARIKEWKDSKLGKMAINCRVTRNGQPLGGAEVKFVPEKYLGDKLPVCTGTSDENGNVMLTAPVDPAKPDEPPGVPPGLYRVEVTKAGDNIPPKYNTETILGQEAAQGAKGIQEGILFDLNY